MRKCILFLCHIYLIVMTKIRTAHICIYLFVHFAFACSINALEIMIFSLNC